MGTWQAPLPIPTTTDVCPHVGHQAKGTWPCHLPGSLTAFTQVRHGCGCPCHWALGLQDHPGRNLKVWCRDSRKYLRCLTSLRNASITGGVPPSQRRKQGKGQLVLPNQTPGPTTSGGVCDAHDHFRDLKEGFCKQVLAVTQDTHRQALVTMVLPEDKIEWLSHSLSCGCQWSRSLSSHTTTEEDGHGLWLNTAGSPQHLHTMIVGDPSPQAHCAQDGRLCLRTAQLMILTCCPGLMKWLRVTSLTSHNPSLKIWDSCPSWTHRSKSSCPGLGCPLLLMKMILTDLWHQSLP